MKYQIWYMRPEWFREGICGEKPDPTNLDATHVFLTSIAIKASHDRADWTLQEVYHRMQGDVWSPNGEARQLIESKGLSHTSMSVGDIAIDEAGKAHIVASFGFEPL